MALPRKLMVDGEHTVATTRTHIKVLFIPFVILLLVALLEGFVQAKVDGEANATVRWILVGIAVVLVFFGTLLPFFKWLAWTYTLTNKRIVEQKGLLTRTGRVIPLNRINDVAFEKNLTDRILGCGTLIIHDASDQAGLPLKDIPRIEAFHRTVTNLVFEQQSRTDESV
ncbi:putative membrane protein YdbT with pleckstrin-like domain [Aeromicrobium panaciterrae]|uniref:Membrane protein YdbT with pleckstrin-like domain n=1 Tax=Aeromicrobium panaciterrae TaxID=363861 RepID=A0ABU1UR16_9ACTN|nr:PH domain-containing protein [Aeromicrobium panaciterrae]MDR7087616.1 putative membrane protein YdbT with pleckstrin-like domain [Aeromicrobium panaciterrae]